jgi:hypothetical protein
MLQHCKAPNISRAHNSCGKLKNEFYQKSKNLICGQSLAALDHYKNFSTFLKGYYCTSRGLADDIKRFSQK